MQYHTISPVWNVNSEILILGSFPSVKSRETGFYYGHKQNRFWKVLAAVYNCSVPENIDDKKHILIYNKIALWDVIASCSITGSCDSTIKDVNINDIKSIIEKSKINHIYLNGKTSEKLYTKYLTKKINIKYTCLPSTSPANAKYSLDNLINEWKIIKRGFYIENTCN